MIPREFVINSYVFHSFRISYNVSSRNLFDDSFKKSTKNTSWILPSIWNFFQKLAHKFILGYHSIFRGFHLRFTKRFFSELLQEYFWTFQQKFHQAVTQVFFRNFQSISGTTDFLFVWVFYCTMDHCKITLAISLRVSLWFLPSILPLHVCVIKLSFRNFPGFLPDRLFVSDFIRVSPGILL